jgi:hypothetical protein
VILSPDAVVYPVTVVVVPTNTFAAPFAMVGSRRLRFIALCTKCGLAVEDFMRQDGPRVVQCCTVKAPKCHHRKEETQSHVPTKKYPSKYYVRKNHAIEKQRDVALQPNP